MVSKLLIFLIYVFTLFFSSFAYSALDNENNQIKNFLIIQKGINTNTEISSNLPLLNQTLEKILANYKIELLKLTEIEIKISVNYYLNYCFVPWGGYFEVFRKRNINLNNNIFILELYPPEEDIYGTLEVRLYEKVSHTDFELIAGKKYSSINKEDKKHLTEAICKFVENELSKKQIHNQTHHWTTLTSGM